VESGESLGFHCKSWHHFSSTLSGCSKLSVSTAIWRWQCHWSVSPMDSECIVLIIHGNHRVPSYCPLVCFRWSIASSSSWLQVILFACTWCVCRWL